MSITIRRSGLLAAATLLFVSGFAAMTGTPARAADVSFSDTIAVQNTNWAQTLTIPQFDPALGTLQSVEVTFTGTVAGTSQVENLDPNGPTTATLVLTATVSVDADPGGGTINIPTTPTSSNTANLGPFDGAVDFAGPSGATFAALNASETAAQTVVDPGVLAAYTGVGNVSLDASATANSSATGGGNVAALFDTDAGASVTVKYTFQPPPAPAIQIEKATNGADADAAPGPTITVGDPVNWTYVVANTGNVDLTNVAVADDQGVVVSCPQTTLAVGESMTCTASGTATAGQYENIGTTTADSAGGPVTDNDLSHYFGQSAAAPAIDVQKTPDSQIVVPGATATFTIVVANTGNVDLINVAVSDPLAPGCDATIGNLAVGASTSYQCTVANVTAPFTNVATVTGEGPGGEKVTDSDDAAVAVAAIAVVKVVNVQSATVGQTVTYTYTVTNTGSVPLTSVAVSDDKLGAITLASTSLAPGESTSGTANYTITSADTSNVPLKNIATASGVAPDGQTVTAKDEAEIPTIVLQAAATTTAATLPVTGAQAETRPIAVIGVALLLAGLVLVVSARRRIAASVGFAGRHVPRDAIDWARRNLGYRSHSR